MYGYFSVDEEIAECEQRKKELMPKISTWLMVFDPNNKDRPESKQEKYVSSRQYERISKKLEKLKCQKDVVDSIKDKLTHKELVILELKYNQGLQHQQTAQRMGIPRRTYYRILSVFLNKVAQNLT